MNKKMFGLFVGILMVSSSILYSQTIQLQKGWNFISITEDINYTKTNLINDLKGKITNIITFNGTVPVLASKINTINPNKGYWIKVNQDVELQTPTGNKVNPLQFTNGWNAVGFGNIEDKNSLIDYIKKLNFKITNIITFNGTVPVLASKINTINPNKAYWIKVEKISVTNPNNELNNSDINNSLKPPMTPNIN